MQIILHRSTSSYTTQTERSTQKKNNDETLEASNNNR